MHIRRMPDEKDIVFEGEVEKPQKTVYRKGESRKIQVRLTSSDEEAQDAKFKILSATLADGSPADVDYDTLKLGYNTLSYTPKGPGTHELTLKVAVEGEEASAKTLHYTVEAPAANWQVAGQADNTGNIALTITDAPEEWRSESWRITSTRWSRGIQGRITGNITQLQAGENTLPITLQEISLVEPPQVHFTLQGPDSTSQSITLDLRAMCVARLEETYSQARIQVLSTHNETVRDQATNYQGNVAGNTRVEAQRTLNALYETTTRLQRDTNEQIERLQSNISILLLQYSADLTVLNNRSVALRHALEKLNESMRILQPMVDQLNASDQGPIDSWGVLYDSLQQGRYDEANMAPHIASPLLSNAINGEGRQNKTLLHLAIEQGHLTLSRRLIRKGAEVNVRDLSGNTPLHYATEANNQEAIALLLGAGAVQNLPPDWQLQGNYEATGEQLLLTIGDAPEGSQQARDPQAQWRITNTTWSEGLEGQIAPNLALQHGENRIPLEINMGTLTEAPTLQVVLQGPDNAFQDITLDLKEVCMARLRTTETDLAEQTERVNACVQETDTNYQLLPETVSDPRANREKQNRITPLLGRITAFQTGYEENMEAFSSNLETLEQTQVNENRVVFEANNKRLKDAIASLKSAQVQLQQQCATAHAALLKTLENENQEAIDILLEDPKLDVNGPIGGYSLLQGVITKNRPDVVDILLQKNADVNYESFNGKTPLYIAAEYGNVEIIQFLLNAGAGADINREIQEGDFDTPLYVAAEYGNSDVVRVLLNVPNIDLEMCSARGYTALDIAKDNERADIIILLERAGAE